MKTLLLAGLLVLLPLQAEAAFPTIFSTQTSQQTTGSTTSNVTLPASIAAGDLIIAMVAADSGAGTATWPSPWVKIADVTGTGFVLSVAYLIASGGETTVAVTHLSERSNHIAARIKAAEWHGTTPPEISAGVTGSSVNPDPDSLSPSWGAADTLWIALSAADDSAIPFPITAWPTNYANNRVGNSTATSAADVAIASRGVNAASENPGAFTMTATETWRAHTIAVRPVTTTIADGTNPGNVTIAPGAAATQLDAFTLVTSTGTDTVTAATVTLAAGTSAGISLVEITSDNGVTVYGSAANPAADAVSITGMSLPVTTTVTQFKVRITPKSHAAMPAPPGATYVVTGTITSFTSTNSQSGTDTASATVTIDNLSPANVTGASATGGNAQVTVSWTNPGDVDFSNVVVLRNTATIIDVPVEGSSPAVNATIGTSIVRYISNGTSFIDTGLTNGTPYFYRVFTKDSSGNYSATGVEVSATPTPIVPRPGAQAGTTTTTLDINKPTGTVQNDGMVASIGFRTNQPGLSSDVGITPPAGWTLVRRLDNPGPTDNGLVVYLKVAGASEPASYSWSFSCNASCATAGFQAAAGGIVSFSGVDTSSPIDGGGTVEAGQNTAALAQTTPSVITTVANTMLVTSHSYASPGTWTPPTGMTEAVDVLAGNQSTEISYVLQAAAGPTGGKQATPSPDDDAGNAHILALRPLQCAAVADATYLSAKAQSGTTTITVRWSSPTNPVLILRKSTAFTGADNPANGTDYSVGNPVGGATVVFKGTGGETSFSEAGPAASTNEANRYYYKVFPRTGSGASTCHATGADTVSASPPSGTNPVWGYSMGGGSILKPGIAGTGTIYTSSNNSRIVSLSTTDGIQSWDPVATTAAVQGWLSWLPVGSASLKAVQTGTGSIGAGALSAALPISPALTDTTKTILVFQAVTGSEAAPVDTAVRCALTTTSTITCDREGTIGTVSIRWYTVEFGGNVKVQHLTGTDCDAVDGTSEVSIPTPVQSMSRTFLLYSQKAQGGGHGSDDFRTVRLINSSQVEIREMPAGCIAGYAYALQVVEHPGVSVTRGLTGTMAAATSSVSVSGLSAVDPAKTMLLYSWRGNRAGTAMCSIMVRGEIDSATSLRFTRGDGAAGCDGDVIDDIAWERIEFTDGAVVRQVQAAMAAGAATANVSFASVATTRTVVFSGGQYTGGQAAGEGSFASDDIVGTMLGLHELTSSTNLLVTRGDTNGTARWTSYVVQFPLSGGAPLVLGGDQSGRVYSVDPQLGVKNWEVLPTGTDFIQAVPAAQVRDWSDAAFQADYATDVIFVATRNSGTTNCGTSTTNNKLFALRGDTGAVLWTFNGTCTDGSVNWIVGMPYVDYARNRVYVTSKSDGSQQSLWVIDARLAPATRLVSPCPACTSSPPTGLMGVDLDEHSPTLSLDGATLYVGTKTGATGKLYAINAADLTLRWTFDLAAGVFIKGFVWEEAGKLYFTTSDGYAWCLDASAGAPAAPPASPVGSCPWKSNDGITHSPVPGASTPLLLGAPNPGLYVGSYDGAAASGQKGKLYQINRTTGLKEKQVVVGDGEKQVGDGSTETWADIFVGTSEGKIFKFSLPLP